MGQSFEATPQHLSRVLGLWDLVFYGMVLISPMAAVPLLGVAQKLSHGFAVTCILISMAAVLLVSSLGCALTGQLGATRLLYSMGRDKVLPKPFAYLGGSNVPTVNVLVIGLLAFLFSQIWSQTPPAKRVA
jgi:amino acid transporter